MDLFELTQSPRILFFLRCFREREKKYQSQKNGRINMDEASKSDDQENDGEDQPKDNKLVKDQVGAVNDEGGYSVDQIKNFFE